MAKDWRVGVDDCGDGSITNGWPSVWSDEEDRAIIHVNGFIQEYWGCHNGSGPTQEEAFEICELIAKYFNEKGESKC